MVFLSKWRFHYLIKLAFFWVAFFLFFKILFVGYNYEQFHGQTFPDVVKAVVMGWRLDLSMVSYLMAFPFVAWSFQQFFKSRVLHLLSEGYHILLIVIITLLSIANIRMYKEWETILNYRALLYLLYPKEAVASVSTFSLISILGISGLIASFGIWMYRMASINFSYIYQKLSSKITLLVLFLGLIVIGIRGGLQELPISESAAYYSNIPVNNHVAANNIWYLAHSLAEAGSHTNPYEFMDRKAAENRIKKMSSGKRGTVEKVLNTSRPNVVIIILESWTADLVKDLGGCENVTPYFDSLLKEGLLFTQAYASGSRTDQGLVSVLSGFPAQPNTSIILIPSKTGKLNSINRYFLNNGYSSSFYYGGNMDFANMKTYLFNTGFQKFIDENDFDAGQINSKWGAHDEYVLSKQLSDLKKEKQPFFSVLLTLSSHEPFEIPSHIKTPFNGSVVQEKFKKAAWYTDHCLGDYFNEARKQSWYSNTLFVLVADHGHHLPLNRDMNLPGSKKITMLMCGGALKSEYRGKSYSKIVAQHDIPAMLLGQLDAEYDQFSWSKNAFDANCRQYAYYSNENVLGWITPEGMITYYFVRKKIIAETPKTVLFRDSALLDAQAYLQCIYHEYLEK